FLPFALRAWYFLPAFRNGFSLRPPPATTPTVALHWGFSALSSPDGSSITALSASWVIREAYVPEDLTSFPPSPGLFSILYMGVPSGIWLSGSEFPGFTFAPAPHST